MARSAKKSVLAEPLHHPLKEPAHLAESQISSLDEDVDDVDPAFLEREWMSEVSKRASEIDSGSVQTESAVEVFRAARAELQSARNSNE